MNPKEVIEAYEALIARGLVIANGAPFNKSLDTSDHPSMSLQDDLSAVLTWRETDYDGYAYDDSIAFPASLLTMGAEELAAWQTAEKAKYDQQYKAARDASALRQQEYERSQYEALKAKFEGVK